MTQKHSPSRNDILRYFYCNCWLTAAIEKTVGCFLLNRYDATDDPAITFLHQAHTSSGTRSWKPFFFTDGLIQADEGLKLLELWHAVQSLYTSHLWPALVSCALTYWVIKHWIASVMTSQVIIPRAKTFWFEEYTAVTDHGN